MEEQVGSQNEKSYLDTRFVQVAFQNRIIAGTYIPREKSESISYEEGAVELSNLKYLLGHPENSHSEKPADMPQKRYMQDIVLHNFVKYDMNSGRVTQ